MAEIVQFPPRGWSVDPLVSQKSLDTGDGGPHDPSMEARIAVLEQIAKSTETTLKEVKDALLRLDDRQRTDFRYLLAAGTAAALALAGLMAHGFHWF